MHDERIRRMHLSVRLLKPLAAQNPGHWQDALDTARMRLRRALLNAEQPTVETHVIVGDHPPEPRDFETLFPASERWL